MSRKKKQKRKLKTLQQALDNINEKSRIIKEISRDVFMGADIGMRKHKDKKKYSRKTKHKKRYDDE